MEINNVSLEPLVLEGDEVLFTIEWKGETFEHYAEFTVYEMMLEEQEVYLTGTVKWEGCSHIHFGDGDGYIHMCGGQSWRNHVLVMNAIWEKCSKKIVRWDSSLAEK